MVVKIGDLVLPRNKHFVPIVGYYPNLGVIIGPITTRRTTASAIRTTTVAWTDGTYTVTRIARLKPYEGDAGDINTLIK